MWSTLLAIAAFAQSSPFTVETDPLFVLPTGQTRELALTLHIPSGTKIYRDMVEVVVDDGAGLTFAPAVLPAGETVPDPAGDEPRELWSGDTRLVVPVSAPGDLRGKLAPTITVFFQGCRPGMCFAPGSQQVQPQVRVVKGSKK